MLLTVLSIISCVLAITGNMFINFKKRIGFIIWILSNISCIIVNFIGYTNYPQVLMYIVYAIINIDGFIRWKRKEE